MRPLLRREPARSSNACAAAASSCFNGVIICSPTHPLFPLPPHSPRGLICPQLHALRPLTIMKTASAVLLSCALVAAVTAGNPGVGTSTDIGGAVAGDFEYLGSLCFPAGTTSTITIDVTSFGNMTSATGLKVLFYDDQAGSFTSLNKKGQSCDERQNLSKQLCVGKSCVSGCVCSNLYFLSLCWDASCILIDTPKRGGRGGGGGSGEGVHNGVDVDVS